jgi:hypothetical protein
VSNFKVEFTLKQHTPIIHFQSGQSGATLRATELKPKLDRFLKKYAFHDSFEEYKTFLIGYDAKKEQQKKDFKDKEAFDYKIHIENSAINIISTPKAYVNSKKETDKTAYQAPYFADVSKSIEASKEIKVTIFSFNKELLTHIDAFKDHLFVYENFGTRQSKGFGSFLRADINTQAIDKILKQHQNAVFTLGVYRDYKDAFLKIDTFYKRLKMGINKPYEKSLIFKYMCNKYDLGWEKKFIKNHFPEVIHGDHEPAQCKEPDDREFKYIRAVLGLAEHNEFRPPEGKKQVKIKSTSSIERFKSPITFKIFNQKIYILFNDSYKDILDEEFTFSLSGHKETLHTPLQFDMYDFLKFVQNKENLIGELQ